MTYLSWRKRITKKRRTTHPKIVSQNSANFVNVQFVGLYASTSINPCYGGFVGKIVETVESIDFG